MARTAFGAFLNVTTNVKGVIDNLEKLEGNCKVAVQRTVSDARERAPRWVSQEIRKEYNIKKDDGAIDKAQKVHVGGSQVNIVGLLVDSVGLEYRGKLLTHTHFGMRPTARPANKKKYKITATVKKGNKRTLHGKSRYEGTPFLAPTSKGGMQIPFQREGSARLPIQAIKTLSVPQMISTERPENVKPEIVNAITEKLNKRFANHVNTLKKKNGLI